jgi:hypothetical protein
MARPECPDGGARGGRRVLGDGDEELPLRAEALREGGGRDARLGRRRPASVSSPGARRVMARAAAANTARSATFLGRGLTRRVEARLRRCRQRGAVDDF